MTKYTDKYDMKLWQMEHMDLINMSLEDVAKFSAVELSLCSDQLESECEELNIDLSHIDKPSKLKKSVAHYIQDLADELFMDECAKANAEYP